MRKFFLNSLFYSVAGMLLLSSCNLTSTKKTDSQKNVILKVGICADVHRDFFPDNELFLQTFIDNMNDRGDIDFIIQLGDFSSPYDYNLPFLEIWNKFKGPAYHVIGNHETDYGFTNDDAVAFLGAKGAYYSFDTKGYHFVVLSGNDINPGKPVVPYDYHSYIGEEQRRWLADDLDKTDLPVIAFCHQSIDPNLESIEYFSSIEQAADTRSILEHANDKAGFRKVRLILSGHHHTDFHSFVNDIHYVSINSMSVIWLGYDLLGECYSEEILEKYPIARHMIPYKDPLWAVMTIYADGEIAIEGRQTEFRGVPLAERGIESPWFVPSISDRLLK